MFKFSPENKPIYEGSLGIFKVITSRISQTLCKPHLGRSGKSSRCTSPPQQAGVAKALPAWVAARWAFVLPLANHVSENPQSTGHGHCPRYTDIHDRWTLSTVCGLCPSTPPGGCCRFRCPVVWCGVLPRWGLLPTYLRQKIPKKGTANAKKFLQVLLHFARGFARKIARGF